MKEKNKKPDVKVIQASKIKTKEDFEKFMGVPVVNRPHAVETDKFFNEVFDHHRLLIDKDLKARDQRSKAGKAPKTRQAIFNFVQTMYNQDIHLSAEQLFRHIRKSHNINKPYSDSDGYEILWSDDGRLYQTDKDGQSQSISYSTFRSYLTKIRKKQKISC